MNLIRAGIPGLVGALALLVGVQQVLRAFEYTDTPSLIEEVRGGLVPIAIGVALLLGALAIARRLRLGYLLGMTIATVASALGAWFFLSLVPHAAEGGFNLAPAFMLFSGIFVLLSVGYGALIRAGRSTFAGAWGPSDRRLAIVITTLLVGSGVVFTALGVVQSGVQGQIEGDTEQARALVDATSFDVSVASSMANQADQVDHLTLDITIRGATSYQLTSAPTLCLTDLVTATEVGKLGVLCWGAEEPGLALSLPNLTVPDNDISFHVELDRGSSICAYLAGPWSASLGLRPGPDSSETFYKQASFNVAHASDASGSAGGETPTPCGTSK